tara:strand:+ start:1152 stop:1466 length:315 start_codon:yes stop_codon:yes gene_type:complete
MSLGKFQFQIVPSLIDNMLTGKELREQYGVSQKKALDIITQMEETRFSQLEKRYANTDCPLCAGRGLEAHPIIDSNKELRGAYATCKHCNIRVSAAPAGEGDIA